jgi:hypothetical protein
MTRITSHREFRPSLSLSTSSCWHSLAQVTYSSYFVRLTGLVGLLAWVLLPFTPLAFAAVPLMMLMVGFQVFHLNGEIFVALTSSFQFWILVWNLLIWLICGFVSIPRSGDHIWENSLSLLVSIYIFCLLVYIFIVTIDSNTIISSRYRILINLCGLVAVTYPLVCDYTYGPVFIDAAEVCFVYCTDTRRLALSASGSFAFLLFRNIISLLRHSDRLLMIQMPIEIEYIPDTTVTNMAGDAVLNV